MNTELRRKSAEEIFNIIKRRKWLIGLPAATIFISVALVVFELPDIYESTSLLSISPPKISEKVAPSLTDADVSQRLTSIGQEVLSRTSLESMITQFDLFESEREAALPAERIVESFKKGIKVDPEKAENKTVVGFRITFRGSDPEKVRKIVGAIAEKYVNAQLAESRQSAETTKEFIDDQLSQAKVNLEELDKRRLEIMTQNVQTLPESGSGLIAQLQGLRQSEQTLSKDKETLITEKGRVQESIRSINSQIGIIDSFGEKETQDAISQATRIEDTPAYAQLVQKRAELTAKLENLRMQYREKNPEIVQIQTEIKSVNDEIDKLAHNTDRRVRSATQVSARRTELQKRNLDIEKDKAEVELKRISQLIVAKEDEIQRNSIQIANVESRLNTIPAVKLELEGINSQYLSAKTTYEDLLKKYNSAQQQVEREVNEQGETITVVDPANQPLAPVNASKKPLFLGGGLFAGLCVGLVFASFLEVPKIFRLQSPEDVEYYTGIRVLATIPPIKTDYELARAAWLKRLQLVGGLVLTLVMIPILVGGLRLSHLFERLI